MKSKMMRMMAAFSLCCGLLALSGCCGGGNAAKTAECKDKNSSDSCKECCGGSYSYAGEGSCTCY